MRKNMVLPSESDIPMHGWSPYSDMHMERIRAHNKHDNSGASMERAPVNSFGWLPVVMEEVGEVARVISEYRHIHIDTPEYLVRLREELVQVGAMIAAWIDAVDNTR